MALDFYLFEGRSYNKLPSPGGTTLSASRGGASLQGADGGLNVVEWLEFKPTIARREGYEKS